MDWVEKIQTTIDHIEAHLTKDLCVDDLGKIVYVSSFQYQKMFTLLCECTVGEYIRNRRMTKAGYDIMNSDVSILELALTYGYQTHESFTRAFTRFHGITPSGIRKGDGTMRTFSKIIVQTKLSGGKIMVNDLSKRGYVVKETGAVYYTKSMDKTVEWFEEVLGWFGQIEMRDEENNGLYGCVNNIPLEIEALRIAPFTGIHLFKGEPIPRLIGFMMVTGIDGLYEHVLKSGWQQITPVIKEAWGGRTCEVTTLDGSILKFFEV